MQERTPRFLTRAAGLVVSGTMALAGCSSTRAPARVTPESQTQTVGAPAASNAATRADAARRQIEAGNDFLKRGLLDEAEHAFRVALEADPSSLEATAGLGRVQVERGHYSEALPLLQRATRVPPQILSAYRSLGDAYAATGDLEHAAEAYRQAVALAPGNIPLRLALARSLTEMAKYDEAEDFCRGSMRGARSDPEVLAHVYGQLGEVYCRAGKPPEAMTAYHKSCELNPRDPELARGAASCAARVGLYAEAAAGYARLLTIAPLDVPAKKQLAWVDFKLERYPEAIRHYESVQDSLGTVDRYYLAQAYAKTSKVDRAVGHFREVYRLDPENYKGVFCNMANAYYEAARYDRAIAVVLEGLAQDSTSSCLRFCWGQALDKLGKHEDAIPVFEAVLNDPAYAEAAKHELERQRRIVRLLRTKE
jgi:tetratricopeptide (TPR) repeat protein